MKLNDSISVKLDLTNSKHIAKYSDNEHSYFLCAHRRNIRLANIFEITFYTDSNDTDVALDKLSSWMCNVTVTDDTFKESVFIGNFKKMLTNKDFKNRYAAIIRSCGFYTLYNEGIRITVKPSSRRF